MKIFAIEGAAFAGKTTLLNYIRDKYSDETITIPEASEYVGGDKNFPNVPFKTLSDAIASTHFFIELEKNRIKDALDAQKNSGHPVILDRSTMVSSLIFYSLLKYTDPDNAKFIDAFYQHAISAFNSEVKRGNIVIPSNIIYIRPKDKQIFESRLGRGTKNGVFSSWSSFNFLQEKYLKLLNQYYNQHCLILDSDNTEENLKENANKVLSFIKSSHGGYINDIFHNFLSEGIFPNLEYNPEIEYSNNKESIDRCRQLILNTKTNDR